MTEKTLSPTLIITTGEPAGIGPELSLMVHQTFSGLSARIIYLADIDLLKQRANLLNIDTRIQSINDINEATDHHPATLLVLPVKLPNKSIPGQLDKRNSLYVLQQLTLANQLCLSNDNTAIVTAPVHKGIINEAGYPFSGHTEFFAHNSSTEQVVMLLATAGMRVALVTTHLPLKDVSKAITKNKLDTIIRIIHQELIRKFSIEKPRITVLGLNPHAGENGHLGDEEIHTIIPVINNLRQQGLDIIGPLPADTAFGSEQHPNKSDVILAMYHDQGLPVLKYRGFGKAINITLGLPYIRTSVDHGTALDLAGSGRANGESLHFAMTEAIRMLSLNIAGKQPQTLRSATDG